MKGKLRNSKDLNKTYISLFIIMLALSIVAISTFAYFIAHRGNDTAITFGTISLSDDTQVGLTSVLYDVVPGNNIVDSTLCFSKTTQSQPFYIRTKIRFFVDEGPDEQFQVFLDTLNNCTNFNIYTDVQNGAEWSEKIGDYFYLVSESTVNDLFVVESTDNYIFSENIKIPEELIQLPDFYQYMKVVKFEIKFQAIQSANMSEFTFEEMTDWFDITFQQL